MDSDEFLTATEAAQKISISKERMALYCREGRLPHAIRKGKIWLIPKSALDEFSKTRLQYRSGRPRYEAMPPIFWREHKYPKEDQAIAILMDRAPHLIHKFISRKTADRYAESGRTCLEKIFRNSLIKGLYERH